MTEREKGVLALKLIGGVVGCFLVVWLIIAGTNAAGDDASRPAAPAKSSTPAAQPSGSWNDDPAPVVRYTPPPEPEPSRTESYSPPPKYESDSGRVHVKGYYRKDGTYVRPHTRSKPKK